MEIEMNDERGHKGPYNKPSDWKEKLPHCIYFYYVRREGATYRERVYVWPTRSPIDLDELHQQIKRLTKNARQNRNEPPPSGWAMEDVVWRKISWVVVAVDERDGKFDQDAAVEIAFEGADRSNHTFFDGGEDEVDIPGEQSIHVMWTLNHMRDAAGAMLTKDSPPETFKFTFNPGRPRAYPDTSGTNMGPPIGPP